MLAEVRKLTEAELLSEVVRIAEIAAPTFQERSRAAYVREQFSAAGFEAAVDTAGNVVSRIPGRGNGAVLVAAHIDTVFGTEVDVHTRLEAGVLHGPGVLDNSAAVAALVGIARCASRSNWVPDCDVILAGTVGEEGRGDLCGIRHLFSSMAVRPSAVVAVDGHLGELVHIGVGSRRFRLSVVAPGGHSWQDYGTPSAVHELVSIGREIIDLPVPSKPRTSLNIGTFSGGTGVNVIAEQASLTIDVRSVSQDEVNRLAGAIEALITNRKTPDGVSLELEVIGDRPAGGIAADHPLVGLASEALEQEQLAPRLSAHSTDANIPLAAGVPAIATGVANGGGIHTLGEYLQVSSLPKGIRQLAFLVDSVSSAVPGGRIASLAASAGR